MPKGKYTRTEAGRLAFLETTGREFPVATTHKEMMQHVAALPEDMREHSRQLYREYMSIGRPEYMHWLQERQHEVRTRRNCIKEVNPLNKLS